MFVAALFLLLGCTSIPVLPREPLSCEYTTSMVIIECGIFALIFAATLVLDDVLMCRNLLRYRQRMVEHNTCDEKTSVEDEESGRKQLTSLMLLEGSDVWSVLFAAWTITLSCWVCSEITQLFLLSETYTPVQYFLASIPYYVNAYATLTAMGFAVSLTHHAGVFGKDDEDVPVVYENSIATIDVWVGLGFLGRHASAIRTGHELCSEIFQGSASETDEGSSSSAVMKEDDKQQLFVDGKV